MSYIFLSIYRWHFRFISPCHSSLPLLTSIGTLLWHTHVTDRDVRKRRDGLEMDMIGGTCSYDPCNLFIQQKPFRISEKDNHEESCCWGHRGVARQEWKLKTDVNSHKPWGCGGSFWFIDTTGVMKWDSSNSKVKMQSITWFQPLETKAYDSVSDSRARASWGCEVMCIDMLWMEGDLYRST